MDGTVVSQESSASPEDVYAVAVAFEEYPSWTSQVKEVEVLDRDEQDRPSRVRYVVDVMVKRISYVLVYDYESDDSFSWKAEPGDDLKMLEGRYEFIPLDGGGTEIVYALRVEPNFSFPGFLRKQAEKQIVGTALRDLRAEAERRAGD